MKFGLNNYPPEVKVEMIPDAVTLSGMRAAYATLARVSINSVKVYVKGNFRSAFHFYTSTYSIMDEALLVGVRGGALELIIGTDVHTVIPAAPFDASFAS